MRFTNLLLALLLLITCPSWATWTLVQNKSNGACASGSTTCAITVTATGTGNLIAIWVSLTGASQTISSVSGGGTYTHPAGCALHSTLPGTDVDYAYTLASTSGATSISVTVTATNGNSWTAHAREFSFTGSSIAFDVCGTRNQSSAVASMAGVALTLTGTNDVIVQGTSNGAVNCSNGPTISPYVDPFPASTDPAKTADLLNTVSGAAPTWSCTTGTMEGTMNAIAFKETVASCSNFIALLGAGCK